MNDLQKFVARYVSNSKKLERLITFIAGVVIWAIVSNLVENLIAWSVALIIFATIIIILVAIYYIADNSEKLQSLAEALEMSVSYEEEDYRKHEGIPYRGDVFRVLQKHVSNAQYEILALAASYARDSETKEEPSREEYLRGLEENIKEKAGKSFEYVRIHQIDPRAENLLLPEYLGRVMTNHSRRLLDLRKELTSRNPDLSLNLLKVKTQRLTNFIVIDRRHVGIEVTNLTSEGKPYTTGMLFIEDRGGKFVKHFLRYFRNMERLAQPISPEELEPKQ